MSECEKHGTYYGICHTCRKERIELARRRVSKEKNEQIDKLKAELAYTKNQRTVAEGTGDLTARINGELEDEIDKLKADITVKDKRIEKLEAKVESILDENYDADWDNEYNPA